MSIEAIAYTLALNVGDSTRKLVLIGFANHAHRDGTASWAGLDTIAEYANCSRRTVQRHVHALVEDGYLAHGDQGLVSHLRADRRPVVYNVAMSEMQRLEHMSTARGDDLTPGVRGDTDDLHGVSPVTERGDTAVSPEPSLNRPVEPDDSLRSSSPTKRRTRLPEDFQVEPRTREWFRGKNITIDPIAETEKFIEHHTAKGTLMIDWQAAWRTWILNARDRQWQHSRRPGSNMHQLPADDPTRVGHIDAFARSAHA